MWDLLKILIGIILLILIIPLLWLLIKLVIWFFGWVFGLGDNVMIETLDVAKQMMDMLKERHKAYREGHSASIYKK